MAPLSASCTLRPALVAHLLPLTVLLAPALSSSAYSTEETRFVCTVLPPDVETACPIVPEDEAQENLLRLKERVAEQRDTIRELTGKLQRCERGAAQGKVRGKSSQVIGDPPPRDPAEVVEHLRGTVRSIMNRVEALEVSPLDGVKNVLLSILFPLWLARSVGRWEEISSVRKDSGNQSKVPPGGAVWQSMQILERTSSSLPRGNP